jgi:hypothetical protein
MILMADAHNNKAVKFSLEDQIKCVRRELALRRTVYPGLIRSGRLHPEAAQQQIACMQAVLDTLTALVVLMQAVHDTLTPLVEVAP